MKNWRMFTGLLVCLFLFAWTTFADQPKEENKQTEDALAFIVEAMVQAGATPETVQLHYGTPWRTFSSRDDVENIAKKMGDALGLTRQILDRPDEFSYFGEKQGVQTELRVIGLPTAGSSKSWQSYVTVRMTAGYKALNELEGQLPGMYNVLGDLKILPQFNSCVQGKYNDTLKNDVQIIKMDQLFTTMGAAVVEKAEDFTVKSYSGYTSKILPFIRTNGKKMNVQAGLHVDHQEQVTWLTIGTPIITMEY